MSKSLEIFGDVGITSWREVYMIMSELWIKNRSEWDLHSCEVTWAGTNKAQKKFWGSNGIWTHDLCDTGAMLYQLSYCMSVASSIYTC